MGEAPGAPAVEEVRPTSIPSTRVRPDEGLIREAARRLAGGRTPVIIVGDGIAYSGAQDELTRVAELLGAEHEDLTARLVGDVEAHPGGLPHHEPAQGPVAHAPGRLHPPPFCEGLRRGAEVPEQGSGEVEHLARLPQHDEAEHLGDQQHQVLGQQGEQPGPETFLTIVRRRLRLMK